MEIEKPLLYDLFAISNHYGSLGGGHYTAYCKYFIDKCRKNGTWNQYDDSCVSEVKESSLCSEGSYVLFYRRQDQ